MSTQGMMCLGLLLIPVLIFAVLFLILPLVRLASHRGQWRCPNCGAVLHDTEDPYGAVHSGIRRSSRELICHNCGYGAGNASGEYRAPVSTTTLGGWLRRRFAPGLARPWERYADEEEFRERVERIERKPTPPRSRW